MPQGSDKARHLAMQSSQSSPMKSLQAQPPRWTFSFMGRSAKTAPMATLKQQLGDSDRRGAVIDDALRVLDAEVADKRGLSGMAIKTAFKVVKGLSSGFLREVVDHLLDDFLDALDPMYQDALAQDKRPSAQLKADPGRVATLLLAITDERAKQADNQVVRKAYDKLRGIARKQVEEAVPRVGAMLDRLVD